LSVQQLSMTRGCRSVQCAVEPSSPAAPQTSHSCLTNCKHHHCRCCWRWLPPGWCCVQCDAIQQLGVWG